MTALPSTPTSADPADPANSPATPAADGRAGPDTLAARAWRWLDAATDDLSRVRRLAFEGQLVLSVLFALYATTAGQVNFYDPPSVPMMRVVLWAWAALHPLFFLAARRPRPERVYFGYLVGAAAVVTLGFMQLRQPWTSSDLGVRAVYMGAVLAIGFMLLPMRLGILLSVLTAGVQVASLLLTARRLEPIAEDVARAVALPAAVCGAFVLLAATLVDRLERRLKAHAARLEAQVAERAAIIERQQQALLQAQKLEAVGTLAAGLAHDFNNLLAVILGYARELHLYADSGPGDPVGMAADVIEASARRAKDLTQRLLGFARQGKVLDVPLDLHQCVDGVLSLVSRNLGSNIRVERQLSADPPFVRGDPVQLQQVLVNLVLNARDAMPAGGTLTVATRLQPLAAHAELPDGTYLQLEVRDTGAGISEAIRERVFDPFFTTKRPGEGTGLGLGLAMVYGIAKAHGGSVHVESGEGRGTALVVRLPATKERPIVPPPARPRLEAEPEAGRGALLVLAQSEVLTGLTQRVRALLAANGTARDADWLEARSYVRAHAKDLDLVLLDRGRT
ncbi:MAG TPA: ATP-binding protein [Myxococcales bacterium]|jgi:signal transduction histidine kinase